METAISHTPGPWAYEPTSGAIYYADDDVEPIIAGINQDNTSPEQADADGRLLAAAPELLDVARLLERTIVYEMGKDEKAGDDEGARMKILSLNYVRAVITKATAA